MKTIAYCLFETELGWCGIAWTEPEGAVVALQLPEATREKTEASIARSSGGHGAKGPPTEVGGVIDKICRHLRGEIQDFRDLPLDLSATGRFAQQVFAAARAIPAGRTMTYGELARALRRPTAARAVGQALASNPIPLIVPCHRILAAGRRPGGYSAPGGLATKARLLAIEGVAWEPRQQTM